MSSAQRHDREDPIDAMPGAAAFEDVYHRLLELAADELHRPVSTTIDTWEDGTFRIRVYHHIAGAGERETLYYHSDEGVVRYGIEGGDRLKDERVVTTIEPPAGSTTR